MNRFDLASKLEQPGSQRAAAAAAAAARAAAQRGAWAESLHHATRASQLSPGNATYYTLTGQALLMLDRAVEASRAYETALLIDARNIDALNGIGIIYLIYNKLKRAEEFFERSLSQNQNQPEILLNLCTIAERLNYREADHVAFARRAVALQPNAMTYLYLGRGLLRHGEPREAMDAISKGLEIAPSDADLIFNLGQCKVQIDETGDALEHFERSISITPEDGFKLLTLAQLQYDLGNLSAAERACHDALATQHGSSSPQLLLARILFAQKRYLESQDAYAQFLSKQGRSLSEHIRIKPVSSTIDWCQRSSQLLREVIPERAYSAASFATYGFSFDQIDHDARSTVPSAYVSEIRSASVIPGHEIILVDDDNLVLYDRLANLQNLNNIIEDDLIPLVDRDHVLADVPASSTESVPEGIFLFSQYWYNYAHWLLEQLPKFWSIEKFSEYDHLPIIVNDRLVPQQLESLELIATHAHPIVKLPLGKRFLVERLIYPSTLTSSMMMRYRKGASATAMDVTLHPEAVHFLRDRLLPLCAETTIPRRRLWVSRKSHARVGQRRMVNEQEIEELFAQDGFEIIIPEKMSFREQICVFSQAEMIAGCAGAGMINMVFAPSDARILMFTKNHPQVNFHYFANVAKIVGQTIAYVCGDTRQNLGIHGFEADFTVAPALARRAMKDFLGL